MARQHRNDLEYQWLLDTGVVDPGQLNDMWMQFLRLLGYRGTVDDMKKQWWADGGIVPESINAFSSGFNQGFG